MVNFGQSVEITLIGMAIVFFVLALLALLLKIQGMFLAPEEGKPVKKDSKREVLSKTSPSNPRMKAAISAALAAYREEKKDKKD